MIRFFAKMKVFVVLGAFGLSGPVLAAETVTFTYDANGRLTKVVRTGTVNNNVQTTYSHDNADNRTNTTTAGSPNPAP